MTKAIRIHTYGGPEEMKWEDIDVPAPGAGEAVVRQSAVGLNFIDVYQRTGLYQLPALPGIIGMEAAGVVEAVGDGVVDIKPGMRVAYAAMPPGAYTQSRLIPADRLVPLPDGIDERAAASMMLKGMTAQYLLRRTYHVKAGDTILIHAAAGGVGQIVCQWAKALGATVIGTVGSEEKAEIARAHGCDHPINYTTENFQQRTRDITNGNGVNVVYDSIGKETFDASLDCLAPLGMMVLFGAASGPVDPVNPMVLAQKGSIFLTRPTLFTYTAKRDDLLAMAGDLFDIVKSGKVNVEVNQTFPLQDAADAHRALEGRQTVGSTVLIP